MWFALVMMFLALVVIMALEVPGMVRKQMWREVAVYTGLLAFGAVLGAFEIMDINIPNPTTITNSVFGPVASLIHSMLE